MELTKCPWCDGTDRNFRPLRFRSIPCNNPFHYEDALRAGYPCKKHNMVLPCIYCENEELRLRVKELEISLGGTNDSGKH